MPRYEGNSFIHIDEVDFVLPYDEPLLEFEVSVPDEIAENIGKYVSRIVQDGDTIQVGYGGIPNAILSHLAGQKHLGVHTELLTDGIVELIKNRVVDNTKKEQTARRRLPPSVWGKERRMNISTTTRA